VITCHITSYVWCELSIGHFSVSLEPVSGCVNVHLSDVISWFRVPLCVLGGAHGNQLRAAAAGTLLLDAVSEWRYVYHRGQWKRLPVPLQDWISGPKL